MGSAGKHAKKAAKNHVLKVKSKHPTSTSEARGAAAVLNKKLGGIKASTEKHGKKHPLKSRAELRKRMRDNVDAWDTGAAERAEERQARERGNKKLKFEPAPATFSLPSREEHLRKQLGDFAGPLMGSLWDEQKDKEQKLVSFISAEGDTETTKVKRNAFSALASSSEDEMDDQEDRKISFRPATLDLSKGLMPSVQFTASMIKSNPGELVFKPAAFSASSLNQPPRSAVDFKPSILSFNAARLTLPGQPPYNTKKDDDFEDL